jgi:rhamnopyranosyl-N-acetylglucosaminyl-diphospho-decaprenol beta-1,3/1,4-galactofuranosyltransferase
LECIDGLLSQTRSLDKIILIDNASTDGTPDTLREKGYLDNAGIDYVRLPENTGGAGGFHEGFKRAFELGYDWLWVMDDDGLPDAETLQNLLLAPQDLLIRGPLILAKEDNTGQKLAFDYWGIKTNLGEIGLGTRKQVEELANEGLLRNYHQSPFNGVLFSSKVVKRIGLPKKEFFLWGDEWDYFFRAQKAGIPLATVLKAMFWHPTNKLKTTKFKILNRNIDICYTNSPLRNYLYIRNHSYLASRYKGMFAWAKHTLRYLLYFSTHSGKVSPLNVLIYSFEGLRGDLRGHQRFL